MPIGSTTIDYIGFEVSDFDGFLEMLSEKGIKLKAGPFNVENLSLRVAFFHDPEGVLVEISEGLDEL